MTSSKVQRTLVKSPPELWTELSDPTALARHLCEFGEIRITRSEPELLVEWESDGARGQVMLKPSGWGTKVTLTVSGELAGGAPEPPSQTPDESATEIKRVSEPPTAGPGDVGQAPVADSGMPGDTGGPADVGAMIGLTRQLAASEPQVEPDPEPAPGEEPPAAIAPEAPNRSAPVTSPLEDRSDPEPEIPVRLESERARLPTTPAHPEPEAKRGFLARLFGRGAQTAVPSPPAEDSPPIGAAATFAGGEAQPVEDIVQPIGAVEPEGAAATESPEAVEPPADILPAELLEEPPAVDALPAPAPTHGTATGGKPEQSEMVSIAAVADSASAPAPAPAELDPEDGGVRSPAGRQDGHTLEGLSAELRAAEEAASEQVTMVLTSVLDRLGSAHHRPFSRS